MTLLSVVCDQAHVGQSEWWCKPSELKTCGVGSPASASDGFRKPGRIRHRAHGAARAGGILLGASMIGKDLCVLPARISPARSRHVVLPRWCSG